MLKYLGVGRMHGDGKVVEKAVVEDEHGRKYWITPSRVDAFLNFSILFDILRPFSHKES